MRVATSSVRVASMPNGDDVDHRSRFDDPIDDAIVAGANAVQVLCALELSDAHRSRFKSQSVETSKNLADEPVGQSLDLAPCRP